MANATVAKHTDVHIKNKTAVPPNSTVIFVSTTVLPGRWIGRASGNDQSLLLWPSRSPDITPCDFFWGGGYVKDRVFVPPLPPDLADLTARIIAAVKNIDSPMLTRVWQELEYRIDMCRVTLGAHIKLL